MLTLLLTGSWTTPCKAQAKEEGEVLYNGIRLPQQWPPLLAPAAAQTPQPPPYLTQRPECIPIDVGRQLFVDDFLIAKSTLTREFHQPVKHVGNPLLAPEEPWEIGKTRQPMAAPFSDGAFFNPTTQRFQLWHMAGWFDGTALATSVDGLKWDRQHYDVVPGTNLVVKGEPQWRRDGVSIWLDHDTQKPEERYKMFLYARSGDLGGELSNAPGGTLHSSPDGIHWTMRGATGSTGDNTTFFYNPFRKVWVFSHRTNHNLEGTSARTRGYTEHKDFYEAQGDAWKKAPPVFWARSDDADKPDPAGLSIRPQLYKIDAVAYESVMLGLFEVLYGPHNNTCAQDGYPKITELQVAFSRDGFHWDRQQRKSFITASRKPGNWERAYVTSTGGCCLIVGDRLHFYYGAFEGDETLKAADAPAGKGIWTGMYAKASTGLATLRRDGFASMNADGNGGTLTTVPVRFQGSHLFVNMDAPEGSLQVEILNEAGKVIAPFTKENCAPLKSDHTCQPVRWKDAQGLSTLQGKPVRFRFHLTDGKLYAFWVSPETTGASHGYVGAGGPGFESAIDTVGQR
ncbi:glycosyl hydrolase family 32 [Roseimicrobium gellanilyticum]|uniref:glycosyl hydrolase family 32 n=1 Tax=Roseimicrobium gellanilyticum TaxID=748857 RepID=UPI0011BEA540|nr:glycosyl hydrolase family 32 [Roseimicrobium gellanilyticum]